MRFSIRTKGGRGRFVPTAVAAAVAAFAHHVPALAQDGTSAEDSITVTGTRIRTPGLVSNSPISSVDQTEINLRQPAAVEDFIRQLPAAVPAIGPGTNNGNNGGATIDLRGLGSNRNLVLIDGRRVVPFTLTGSVDTNAIPIGMLERVDLVTGGASAVYGADAVTGVVNFVLRRDFQGVDLSASGGRSAESDGDTRRVDITLGTNTADGKGNVMLGFGYTTRDPVLQGDRPFGESSISSVSGLPEGSSAGVPTASVLRIVPGQGNPQLAQFDPAQGMFVPFFQTFNFNPLNLYQAPLERTQFTSVGRYEIASFAEAYANLMFTKSDVGTQLAPSGTFFNIYDISVANPFLTDAARQQLCDASTVAINDCSATSAEIIRNVQLRRRFTELGPRLQNFENQLFQYTVGLRGPILDGWDYDAYWSRGQSDQTRLLGNWGSFSRVRQALLATNPDTCTNTANGCVPLNLFGPEGSITPEMLDFINLTALQQTQVVQEVGSVSVSGDLGDLRSPATALPIGVAFGLEHRRVTASTLSDDASQIQNEILGTGAPTPDRSGSFKLNELYAELLAPLVTDAPGIHSLVLEAGIRRSEFSTTSSRSFTTSKLGLSYEPTQELRFRTMLQRATRAPNVNELFAPEVTGLSNLAVDPCQGDSINQAEANTPGTLSNLCRQTGVPQAAIGSLPAPAAGQINVLSGGNPNLGPEKADTLTVGFVWQPSLVERLTLTLDYYDIDLKDAVSSPSSADIINDCYDAARNPNREFNAACQLIGRSPITGDLNAGDARGVALLQSNLGKVRTSGIDFGALYALDLPDPTLGSLSFALNVTRVSKWEFQATPSSINRDCLGFYSVACSNNIYKLKGNLRTTWTLSDYDVSLNWRYLDGLDVEPLSRPPPSPSNPNGGFLPAFESIGSYSYFDLTGQWRVLPNARLTLTINNLFDKDPPSVGNTIGATATNSGNTFPQFYDTIGRYYTLGFGITF